MASSANPAVGAPAAGQRVELVVAEVAARQPGALAVAAADGTLTYRQLDERAGALAEHLAALGVGPGELVALRLPRSAALVVGALGILRTGAAYVALDPDAPEDRLDWLIEDCGASVMLTTPTVVSQSHSAARHPETTLVELTVDAVRTARAAERSAVREPAGEDGSPLAYVVYTSGSTGLPKGVLLEHAGLLNLISWHREAFALTARDRGSQVASPGFDAATWEIWPYLAAGASIHVPPTEVRADPTKLRDWLVANEITVSFLPTALAEQVTLLPWPATSALRLLLTGGDRLRQSPPPGLPFALVNNYGLSEATVVSTSGVVSPGRDGTPSLGSPISGVQVAIVDSDQRRLPAGEVGELMVGGVSVARGYHNQPELTADRFVNPWWAAQGERWYRTGDLCRQLCDGEVEFLGRLDDQVQLRGVRIEPGEISAWLDQHPDVLESVVVAVGERANERRLYAYVVARDESRRPSRRELQDHLAAKLPAHMVPSAFGWIPAIPHNQNGKVDRGALPAPSLEAEEAGASSLEAPGGNPLEEAVAAMVAELLGVDSVAPQDNFFLLGGHSLLGAQLIARISDQFGLALGLRTLFDNPTIAGLALALEDLILAETSALSEDEATQLLGELDAPAAAGLASLS